MTKTISKTTAIFLFIAFILSACKKDVLPVPPNPPAGDTTKPNQPAEMVMFRFATTLDLAGQPYHSSNLNAVVSIAKENGEEVIKEKILALNLNGLVTTAYLKLATGNYKLTSFRLVYGSVNTHFAAPIAGSFKAASVQKPLALDFKIESSPAADVPVEVLKVEDVERPQLFGYPSGAFDHGQSDANPYMKVRIRAIMQIGDVLYDSIPASLRLTTWNDKGEMTTTYSPLAAGVNEVPVLKAAVKYEFMVSKWGTNDAMTLNRQDVDNRTVYTLGGSKEAKKLKSERVYKQVNGTDVPESKTDYSYDASGKLSKIEYWLRKQDKSPFLAFTDKFEYTGGKVQKISRVDEENDQVVSVTSFSYDQQGKVKAMSQKENGNETNAKVEYAFNAHQEVNIQYEYPGKTYSMNYHMIFYKGNLIEGTAATSNQNNETGRYSYDFGINPYVHMKWPDLFLSRSSKNNITSQSKTYHGSYPTADPYSMFYTYDADGYPKEVVKNFRSYATGNYAFSTKTVFVY